MGHSGFQSTNRYDLFLFFQRYVESPMRQFAPLFVHCPSHYQLNFATTADRTATILILLTRRSHQQDAFRYTYFSIYDYRVDFLPLLHI